MVGWDRITLKSLRVMKDTADKLPENSEEKLRALFVYHDSAVEYWDGQWGNCNDDSRAVREHAKHEKKRDKVYNQIMRGDFLSVK